MDTDNQKKKILIFSTAYHPFIGGAEVAIKEITHRLKTYEFDLITARFKRDMPTFERVGNVNVYRVGFGMATLDKVLLPFLGAIKTRSLNKKNNYFCFWGVMMSYASLSAYVFNIFKFIFTKKRIPIVLTLQEGDSEEHLNYRWFGLIALSWKVFLRQTDILTGISTFLIHRAEKNGYSRESFLVPNGVDFSIFSEEIAEPKIEEIKRNLNKKENDIFLVTTGRLTHKNAIDDVIRSLTMLPDNISFVIIGKGMLGESLQKLAKDLNVKDRVKFLGFVDYNDIPKYLRACDIFIRPSRSEGFGNSFIEAMASGLPVIATPVGGITDFITDKETGFFCTPDNPKSIAVAVKQIISDKKTTISVIRNAYLLVKERYDWNLVSKKMQDVFDKIK